MGFARLLAKQKPLVMSSLSFEDLKEEISDIILRDYMIGNNNGKMVSEFMTSLNTSKEELDNQMRFYIYYGYKSHIDTYQLRFYATLQKLYDNMPTILKSGEIKYYVSTKDKYLDLLFTIKKIDRDLPKLYLSLIIPNQDEICNELGLTYNELQKQINLYVDIVKPHISELILRNERFPISCVLFTSFDKCKEYLNSGYVNPNSKYMNECIYLVKNMNN